MISKGARVAVLGLVALAAVLGCGGGGDVATDSTASTFECGDTRCRSDQEYCHSVQANPKTGAPASRTCIANPCGGKMDCTCITADAEKRTGDCNGGGCDLRNTSGVVVHAYVGCEWD